MRLPDCASLGVNREMLRQCPGWETESTLPNITSRAVAPPLLIIQYRRPKIIVSNMVSSFCLIFTWVAVRRAACGGKCTSGTVFINRSHIILWIITCYDAGARLACNRSPYSSGDAHLSAIFCASSQTFLSKRPTVVCVNINRHKLERTALLARFGSG